MNNRRSQCPQRGGEVRNNRTSGRARLLVFRAESDKIASQPEWRCGSSPSERSVSLPPYPTGPSQPGFAGTFKTSVALFGQYARWQRILTANGRCEHAEKAID